jgi:hypothetical protein
VKAAATETLPYQTSSLSPSKLNPHLPLSPLKLDGADQPNQCETLGQYFLPVIFSLEHWRMLYGMGLLYLLIFALASAQITKTRMRSSTARRTTAFMRQLLERTIKLLARWCISPGAGACSPLWKMECWPLLAKRHHVDRWPSRRAHARSGWWDALGVGRRVTRRWVCHRRAQWVKAEIFLLLFCTREVVAAVGGGCGWSPPLV